MGYSSASVQNVKNSGYVNFKWTNTSRVVENAYLGGIVGKMDGDGTISGCVNEGGASNAGEVALNITAAAIAHTNNYIGGIVGHTVKNVTLSDCINSGYIHGGNNNNQAGKTCFVGGIVAYLAGARWDGLVRLGVNPPVQEPPQLV